jgi:hypothetical protein
MAEHSYTANRSLVVAGQPVAEVDTFTAEPEALSVALARGWVAPVERQPKQPAKRTTARKRSSS